MDAQFSLLFDALVCAGRQEAALNPEATSSLEQALFLCSDRYDRYELCGAYVHYVAEVCSNRIEGQ
jgi:hypothetical protein